MWSHIVVRSDSGIDELADLRGRVIAVGAKDSPQATLLPLALLQKAGLEPDADVEVRRFDVLVGKHGDHVGGELEAFRSLERGEADACAMVDLNWNAWTADGTVDPARYRVLASTERYDHCVFAVRDDFPEEREKEWLEVLFSMDYDNPAHREMMELEGLKEWLPGRTTGFGPLADAIERQRYFAAAT
jgi:phosphonate transport system substrate-binding protein